MITGLAVKPQFKFSPERVKTFYASVVVVSDGYGDAQHHRGIKGPRGSGDFGSRQRD